MTRRRRVSAEPVPIAARASRNRGVLAWLAVAALAAGLLLLWLLVPRESSLPPGPIELHDITAETGITFVHTDGSSGEHYIPETVTAGLASFDYDNDGLIDVYFVNGAPLGGMAEGDAPQDALYRNGGNWRFSDVTGAAGVGDRGFGLGVAAGDYDNDGDADLYITNFGTNILYRNNGDGTFTDVTAQAGVAGRHALGAGTCFLDIEGDGDLDLYAANYVDFNFENHVPRDKNGYPEYAGPNDYQPLPDILYRNNGDGTFTDISRESGVGLVAGSGMGMVCADWDRDGDSDIFVLNDVAGNFFFQNDGQGRFEEIGVRIGAAYTGGGDELGSMGIDCGDYDNDGWLDFYQTSYQAELPQLFHNAEGQMLEDRTIESGAGAGCYPFVNWGCGLVDFDNDGFRDIYVANGHLQDLIDRYDQTTAYENRNVLLRNNGDGTFRDVSDHSGGGTRVRRSSRGAAFDDLDNDGRIDVVVLNSRRGPTVLRNDSRQRHHFLQVQLRGTRANRDGVGSRVVVAAGDLVLADEVHSGRGYQGHFGSRLHFGLGRRDRVDRVEVHWLGGGTDVLENVPVDRLMTVVEGQAATGERQFGRRVR
ncbi:MAG: VCBS repeat-containing protein [Thermoguttaceae bacterium]|nr:VCBS repeat-containing protein [Thermoguttaceae bacterium]